MSPRSAYTVEEIAGARPPADNPRGLFDDPGYALDIGYALSMWTPSRLADEDTRARQADNTVAYDEPVELEAPSMARAPVRHPEQPRRRSKPKRRQRTRA